MRREVLSDDMRSSGVASKGRSLGGKIEIDVFDDAHARALSRGTP